MKAHISSRSTVEGLAFPDHIKSGIKSRHRRFDDDSPSLLRIYFLPFFIVIFAFILILKTASLQLIQGEYYKSLADNNRTRTIMIRAPRGIIFDRNNEPLVFNVPGFRKIVNGKIKLLSREEAMEFIAKGKKDLEVDSLRQYPYKDIFAHILGYIGQISEEELKNSSFADYQAGELIGKSGIEEKYESELKGIDGKQLVEVNAAGERIRTLGQVDPIPGKDITLTVDAKLQKAAFLALEKVEKDLEVDRNPKGEILAMVSKPSFDANLFTMGEKYSSSGDYKKLSDVLLDSDGQPLLNRAISGVYPPGSTFKIITAAAGLEEKKIDENFEVVDTGILKIGSFSFANWFFTQHGKTDGDVNVIKALARSNDIFFYKLAEIIGVDKISEMSKKFGLGAKLGIDLKGEAKGTVPSNEWKKKVIGEQWYLGDTYHYGIGQGYLLTTPLQVNALTQVIANGGSLYEPHLLKNQKSK
ncbi:MAG: penicillin-binding transpeptidase domain-containing protein, partial [Patescibacteria group bacterium]|nr:penicillin-binding transpeptidase domain-containing protein [Patescibacteria group bacterium]